MPRPRSTLFPYTTLFRSGRPPVCRYSCRMSGVLTKRFPRKYSATSVAVSSVRYRSEERFSRNAETEIYTLSLHDALPIWSSARLQVLMQDVGRVDEEVPAEVLRDLRRGQLGQVQIGRAVQQECRDRDLHSFPTRRSSDLVVRPSAGTHAGCRAC